VLTKSNGFEIASRLSRSSNQVLQILSSEYAPFVLKDFYKSLRLTIYATKEEIEEAHKILTALRSKGRMRYSDLADFGYATTTTRALKAMEEAKLITKQVMSEPYRPVVYSLTEKGKKVSEIVADLQKL
jgi:DNA-binding MarR family transcriptional regulator